MNDKNKRIFKYVIIAILIMFPIWLFGFKISFLKVDDNNPEQYTLKYRGHTYYGKEYYSWRISDSKFIGFANGLSNIAYKSSGDDNKKFIEIWDFFNAHLRGYGIFYRDDILLENPSSENVGKVYYSYDKELGDIVREEIVKAFESYNEDNSYGINLLSDDSIRNIKSLCTLSCKHSEYNLSLWLDVYLADNNYYIHNENYARAYLPISKEAGELIQESIKNK